MCGNKILNGIRWIALCSLLALTMSTFGAEKKEKDESDDDVVEGPTVYKWVDKQGKVHYSDKPRPGAKKVKLVNPATVKTQISNKELDIIRENQRKAFEKPKPKPKPFEYVEFEITTPKDDDGLGYGEGTMNVALKIEPQLRKEDYLTVSINGQTKIEKVNASNFQLVDLERGENKLLVQLYDKEKKLLKASSIVFYLF